MYADQFKIQAEISRRQTNFEKWKDDKQHALTIAQSHSDLHGLDLSQKHDRRRDRLENELEETYGTPKATIKAELETINRKLQAKGVRKLLRDVFGKTRHDSTYREEMAASLRSIEQRENEQRSKLERQIKLESKRHNDRMTGLRTKANTSIERRQKQLKERAKLERSATPTTAPFIQPDLSPAQDWRRSNDNTPQAPNKARTEAKAKTRPPVQKKAPKAPQRENAPPPEPSGKVSLADQKTTPDIHLPESKSLSKPWTRQSIKPEGNKPWTREGGGGLNRKPKPPKGEPS